MYSMGNKPYNLSFINYHHGYQIQLKQRKEASGHVRLMYNSSYFYFRVFGVLKDLITRSETVFNM